MKKTGLFKIIMIVLFSILVVTWLVPASYYSGTELADLGMYRIGFFDFFQLIFGAFQFGYFIQILLLLLSIGALYGVLGRTGKYRAWIEKIASKFKRKGTLFLIIVAVVIALITSAFDYGLTLVIFIPAIISIILCMGYDKITAILATFGAMLIGTIGATYNDGIVGSINAQLTDATYTTGIYYKLALLVVSLAILIIFLAKAKKVKNKVEEKDSKSSKKIGEAIEDKAENDIFLGEKISNKYPVWPICALFIFIFILLVLALTPWQSVFNLSFFSDLHNTITTFTIGEDTTIFGFILGTITALGEWYYAEMSVICILAALLIGKIYRMTLSETFVNMKNGVLKILPAAVMVMFVYVVVYLVGNTMFFNTIADKILSLTKNFNIFLSSIVMIIGSALHVDMLYVASYMTPQFAGMYTESHMIIGLLSQGLYGATMIIAPTSAFIVFGLTYLGVPYKEWLKKVWKLAVALIIVTIIVALVASLI